MISFDFSSQKFALVQVTAIRGSMTPSRDSALEWITNHVFFVKGYVWMRIFQAKWNLIIMRESNSNTWIHSRISSNKLFVLNNFCEFKILFSYEWNLKFKIGNGILSKIGNYKPLSQNMMKSQWHSLQNFIHPNIAQAQFGI